MDQSPRPLRNANLPIGRSAGKARNFPTAHQQIGVPKGDPVPTGSAPRGWHSRGYLPHFDADYITQAVTVHLADSLPKEVVEKWAAQINALPQEDQDVERRKRVEAYIDAGHGCCILCQPAIAQMVQDSFFFFDAQRYRLFAWVIMPNHIHVLFQPIHGWTLNKIVASWKKFTARKICDYWSAHPDSAPKNTLRNANLPIDKTPGNVNLPIGKTPRHSPRLTPRPDPVWHPEFWDRFMRDQRHFRQSTDYIHRNPVKAGLVAHPEDWPWSSAHPMNAPGNANLPIGNNSPANQEIGVPRRKPP